MRFSSCRFTDSERGHATCNNEVVLCPIKIYLSASSVDIKEEDSHRCVDRKAINKFCTEILCDVENITYRTIFTHPLAVLVHTRPELSLVNPVVSAVHIEVPANGIGMESHEYCVG